MFHAAFSYLCLWKIRCDITGNRFYRTPFSVNLMFNNLKIYDYGKS
nr:MAG TPA: hypothetical protein [Bacteriophage sp.]